MFPECKKSDKPAPPVTDSTNIVPSLLVKSKTITDYDTATGAETFRQVFTPTYDTNGRLLSQIIQNSNANGSGGTVNYGYSYVVGAVSQTSVYPGNPAVVSNATWFVDTGLTRVDSAYELTTVVNVPASGSIVRFSYDAAGLCTRQTGAGWKYDATGKAQNYSTDQYQYTWSVPNNPNIFQDFKHENTETIPNSFLVIHPCKSDIACYNYKGDLLRNHTRR